ncbi:MAG: SDR family oxidoreductase [Sandaracinaceae bacterium]|nr:SDR family oxidoreductase [Sandaracinaceae bacterium]
MTATFITGGTGYLGSYVVADLIERGAFDRLYLMSRTTGEAGVEKLWKAMQLHWTAEKFYAELPKIELVAGDLHGPGLGLTDRARERLLEDCDSVLHVAASLNRKSSKACFNANLRGTLSVAKLVRDIAEARGGLRRFGYVSTTAVSGEREHEVVTEDASIDWDRSDYDPYARTKKFAEHMIRELLPDLPIVILRPPTVMGDSEMSQTAQFDMIRFYTWMVDAPAVPINGDTRLDFVPANFVGSAISELFTKPELAWDCYHLSAGEGAKTAREHEQVFQAAGIRTPFFVPGLNAPTMALSGQLAGAPRGTVSLAASLMKVFLPYFSNDVVFDNTRVVTELGRRPAPFTDYCVDLYRWVKSVHFEYPYAPLPARPAKASAATRAAE